MSGSRHNVVQITAAAAAEMLERCLKPMARLDESLAFTWVNGAWQEAFAFCQSRWPGLTLEALDTTNPELVVAARRALQEQQVVLLRQIDVCSSGGEPRWQGEIGISPRADGGVLLEAPPAQVATGQASPALSESLRGLAHEVKNPLAGVRGAAQLLSRRVEAPSLRELADLIIDESDRLTALVDRLLHAGVKARLARINIHEVLERVAALVEAEPDAPRVQRDYDPSLPAIRADRDRLHQLLLNLLRNAIEADARQITLRTRLEFGTRLNERLRRAVLRVEVVDDGRGVPADLRDSIFLPLVSGRADGSGLGLALAREIAIEHGAELSHSSRPGVTVFCLRLPLEASP